MESQKSCLMARMEAYFGEDEGRIQHAHRVTEKAELILHYEANACREVVIAAAILHDIGIPEAQRKYGSTASKYQEIEGPPIAREIMRREGLPEGTIEKACRIIAHHHTPGVVNTKSVGVVYDADLIVNLGSRERSDSRFLTAGGEKVYASQRPHTPR